MDVSESMVSKARVACPRTEFVIKDLTREPHTREYDIVTAFRFFGNAEHDLRAEVFLAVSRVLRRGGLFVLNNHRNPYALNSIAGYLTGGKKLMDLSHWMLLNLAKNSGFRLDFSIPIGAWLFRHSLARNELLRSKTSERLERIFSSRLLVPFAPDAIYVFRKE
jgi:SAM-dependent methyltransferase